MPKCPLCEGKGEWLEGIADIDPPNSWWEKCPRCKATGRIGIVDALREWFWNTVPVRFMEWYIDQRWPEKT